MPPALTLTFYWLIGIMLLISAYTAMPQRPPLKGLHGLVATILGCLLWPIALLSLWYDQQQRLWKAGPLHTKHWLKEKESGGKYVVGRVTIIIRYAPRKVIRRGQRYTILLRPRPSLNGPILASPNALHLNFVGCQVIFMRDLP